MKYWYHRKCCKIKWMETLERLIEYKWNFLGIQVFMRAFYENLNRVDCIFSSKVAILPNNRKHYLKFERPLIFRCQWYGKLSSFLILTRTFQNWPNKRYSISGSKNIVSRRLYAFYLFANNCWCKQKQETYPVWSSFYF